MAEHGILAQDAPARALPPRAPAALGGGARGGRRASRAPPGPHLTRLRDECRETVVLAELHDIHVVPVLRVDGLYEMRMNQEVGRRYPAHAGATGKVADRQPARGRAPGAARPARARAADAEDDGQPRRAARASSRQISELGVAVTIGERVPDAVAISAPVFDAGGRVVAALTIGGIASPLRARAPGRRRALASARRPPRRSQPSSASRASPARRRASRATRLAEAGAARARADAATGMCESSAG